METKNKLTRGRKEEWKIWGAKGTLSYAKYRAKAGRYAWDGLGVQTKAPACRRKGYCGLP